jgi:NAD(P)-dependent dehydrogenase (short-subunit alcohol dehydrogenase family)
MYETRMTAKCWARKWRAGSEAIPAPNGRFAKPYEIADGVVSMISPTTTHRVGAFLVIDGGVDALVRPYSS